MNYVLDLLAPLTSAAELASHPSMSTPYKSNILGALVQQACEMVHKEKRTLWLVKHLAMKLRGDPSWIPCEAFCSDNDVALFASQRTPDDGIIPRTQERHKVNELSLANETATMSKTKTITTVGLNFHDHNIRSPTEVSPQTRFTKLANTKSNDEVSDGLNVSNVKASDDMVPTLDTVLLNQSTSTGVFLSSRPEDDIDQSVKSSPKSEVTLPKDANRPRSPAATVEEKICSNSQDLFQHSQGLDEPTFVRPPLQDETMATVAPTKPANEDVTAEQMHAPIHRMTTRAQAQAVSDKTASTHSRSPSPDSSSPPYIHPLFLMPPSALPDRDFGLPPDEAEETRCILVLWVQKQEEVCRRVEQLYEGLLKADRMRKTVLRWCKAEGHIGVMSDGEDWYDREEWGLEEDLKKGQLEEEDDNGNQGKKTRGRRAQ